MSLIRSERHRVLVFGQTYRKTLKTLNDLLRALLWKALLTAEFNKKKRKKESRIAHFEREKMITLKMARIWLSKEFHFQSGVKQIIHSHCFKNNKQGLLMSSKRLTANSTMFNCQSILSYITNKTCFIGFGGKQAGILRSITGNKIMTYEYLILLFIYRLSMTYKWFKNIPEFFAPQQSLDPKQKIATITVFNGITTQRIIPG